MQLTLLFGVLGCLIKIFQVNYNNLRHKKLIKSSFIYLLSFSLIVISSSFKRHVNDNLIFRNNDRVVFVGNSITARGLWLMNIQNYYQTRYPQKDIQFFNCGISGNTAADVINRLDSDILPIKPTVAVIKLGMNDASSKLYESNPTNNELITERNRIVAKYKLEVIQIIKKLKDNSNPHIYIIKPSPYDETVKQASSKAQIGKNETILKICSAIDEIATEFNATVVDFFNPMLEINTRQQAIDSTFTITSKDRVHPGPMGNLIMSYLFLRHQNVPEIVSETELNIKYKRVVKSINSKISKLRIEENVISFEMTEKSLPFAIEEDAIDALKYISINDLNKEIIILKGLKSGNYKLKIDGVEIGVFKSNELIQGVNLATYPKTPQNEQAKQILKQLSKASAIRTKIRGMLLAKSMLKKEGIELNDKVKLSAYIEERISVNPFYGIILHNYIDNAYNLNSIEVEIKKLLIEAKRLSQPIIHKYEFSII